MIITFATEHRGKIEIDTQTRAVYFHRDDIYTQLHADNTFEDLYGTPFHAHIIHGPMLKDITATLDELAPRTIARTDIAPSTITHTPTPEPAR